MNLLEHLNENLSVGGAMVYPLIALSILSLAIISDRAFIYWRYARLTTSLRDLIETYGFAWEELEKMMGGLDTRNYFVRFFQIITANRAHPVWWVENRAADEAGLIEKKLGKGMWALDTSVTAAPLLGLLGTIIGMIHSFSLFGGHGLVNPNGITGGVAQALISTALGIAIALVALFGFNFFSRLQSQTLDEMERLGTRLANRIQLDQHKSEPSHEIAQG
jgi:biopolymer transport protein ExbB